MCDESFESTVLIYNDSIEMLAFSRYIEFIQLCVNWIVIVEEKLFPVEAVHRMPQISMGTLLDDESDSELTIPLLSHFEPVKNTMFLSAWRLANIGQTS